MAEWSKALVSRWLSIFVGSIPLAAVILKTENHGPECLNGCQVISSAPIFIQYTESSSELNRLYSLFSSELDSVDCMKIGAELMTWHIFKHSGQ